MSPRTGRPPSENPKSDRVTVRLTEYQQEILADCVKKFGTSKADIVCRGLDLMEVELNNSEARQLFDAIVILEELIKNNANELVSQQIEQVKSNFKWYLESVEKK